MKEYRVKKVTKDGRIIKIYDGEKLGKEKWIPLEEKVVLLFLTDLKRNENGIFN